MEVACSAYHYWYDLGLYSGFFMSYYGLFEWLYMLYIYCYIYVIYIVIYVVYVIYGVQSVAVREVFTFYDL